MNVSEDENFVTDKEEIEKEGEKEEYDNKRVLEEEGLLRNWISTEVNCEVNVFYKIAPVFLSILPNCSFVAR